MWRGVKNSRQHCLLNPDHRPAMTDIWASFGHPSLLAQVEEWDEVATWVTLPITLSLSSLSSSSTLWAQECQLWYILPDRPLEIGAGFQKAMVSLGFASPGASVSPPWWTFSYVAGDQCPQQQVWGCSPLIFDRVEIFHCGLIHCTLHEIPHEMIYYMMALFKKYQDFKNLVVASSGATASVCFT